MNMLQYTPRLVSSLAVCAVLLSACGTTTHFTRTNPSPRPLASRPAEDVQVFVTNVPDAAYTEVGVIQSRQSSGLSLDEMPEIIGEMRSAAARIGCDAVIIRGPSDEIRSYSDRRGNVDTTTLEGYWGACVMYTDPAANLCPASVNGGARAAR